MKKLLILLVAIVLISCKDDEEPVNPWNAEHLATLISNGSDWEKEYSDANILTETKFMNEFNADKTVKTLYPETEDELVVIFNGNKPEQLYWFKSGSWTTPYGTVGDPITVLEKANGAGVQFYGLGYDLPGKVKIDSGKLAGKDITFAVRPTSDIIPTEYYSYNSFDASNPKSKDLKLYITRVQMGLPIKMTSQSGE
ncbi:hypothetical protein [Nonlabens antarcticus]|uniref:hypothetical protein n=1 Tax=Nonlabens antarcticus TaxID=392714 RepID=UPI001890CA57|nr:hypothetical protein [Nonlabens antarcticus]